MDRSARVRAQNGISHFVVPATKSKTPKLYVVSKDGFLLYVGVTKQPMSSRLRGGLTANGTHGYHGYAFGRENHTLSLDIWYLEGDDTKQIDLEIIEAEVVFLYRQQSGRWPKAQTEIHFHQSENIHKQFAKQILDALKEK